MPILDATSLIAFAFEEEKKEISWIVAAELLHFIMRKNPLELMRTLIKDHHTPQFTFLSYIDTSGSTETAHSFKECPNKFEIKRTIFTELFESVEDCVRFTGCPRITHKPLGELIHQNSKTSCTLALLQEMLGPNFLVYSKECEIVGETPWCDVCSIRRIRIDLIVHFVKNPRSGWRSAFIYKLWPNFDVVSAPEDHKKSSQPVLDV